MPEYINSLNLRHRPGVGNASSSRTNSSPNLKNNEIQGGIAGNPNRQSMPDFNFDTP